LSGSGHWGGKKNKKRAKEKKWYERENGKDEAE
jgi:hypothetical protein